MCGRDFLASRIQFTAWLSNPEKISKNLREARFSEKFLRNARPPDSVLRTLGRVIVNVTSARTSRKPSYSTGSFPALGATAALSTYRGRFPIAALIRQWLARSRGCKLSVKLGGAYAQFRLPSCRLHFRL